MEELQFYLNLFYLEVSSEACSHQQECAVGMEHIPAAPSPQPHTLVCNQVTAICSGAFSVSFSPADSRAALPFVILGCTEADLE